MTQARILILTVGSAKHDGRPLALAAAASAAGADVDVVEIPVRARAARAGFRPSPGSSLSPRRALRSAVRMLRLAGRTWRFTLGAARLPRPTVVHANDVDGLPAAWLISRVRGARLVYHSFEIHVDQEPDPPRLHLRLVDALERRIGARADAVVASSQPIADDLQRRVRRASRPIVSLHAPALVAEPPHGRHAEGLLRVIYQGAPGPGRDLDDLLAALASSSGWTLGARVVGLDAAVFGRAAAARGVADRVEVLAPVDAKEIVRALAGFDVGVIINRPVTRNDDYVLPSKFFAYLMAGLPVVAPDLATLGPLIAEEGLGRTYVPGDPTSLGAVLEQLAEEPEELTSMSRRCRTLAVERFNAEAQRPALYDAWGLSATGARSARGRRGDRARVAGSR